MVVSNNKKRKSTDLEGNVMPGSIKSNEKKDTAIKGARKSLADNGSSKFEKTTSTEKTVPVDEEAGGKPPGNKRKNRKRSLSQRGSESVVKTPKLEMFAGTASLDSDKIEEAGKKNHAARRHQQTKEKKKLVAKSNKLGIKAKILEGDIEAQRNIQAKLDALLVKPAAERSNTTNRKIRQFQSWLKIKSAGSSKQLTVVGKVQKSAQKKNGPNVQTQQVIKTEALQINKEEPQSDDDDSDKSNEGDFEMLPGENRTEEGSDEEDSDIDEDDPADVAEDNSKVVVNEKSQKQNQVNKKLVNTKPQQQNRGKGFGKPGNKKFARHQKKSPLMT